MPASPLFWPIFLGSTGLGFAVVGLYFSAEFRERAHGAILGTYLLAFALLLAAGLLWARG